MSASRKCKRSLIKSITASEKRKKRNFLNNEHNIIRTSTRYVEKFAMSSVPDHVKSLMVHQDDTTKEYCTRPGIQATWDYNQFRPYHPANRHIDDIHVEKLKTLIIETNGESLEWNPVKVDKYGNPFDGQHRIEACERSGFPVFYVVMPDNKISMYEAMLWNSSSSVWPFKQYLISGAIIGNEKLGILYDMYELFDKDYGCGMSAINFFYNKKFKPHHVIEETNLNKLIILKEHVSELRFWELIVSRIPGACGRNKHSSDKHSWKVSRMIEALGRIKLLHGQQYDYLIQTLLSVPTISINPICTDVFAMIIELYDLADFSIYTLDAYKIKEYIWSKSRAPEGCKTTEDIREWWNKKEN